MNKLFSERFKSARLMNGMSLQDLADKMNNTISKQALHKYEKGLVIPDSEMIGYLCEILKVRPDYFFRENMVELGEIEFRKLKKLPSKDENRIVEIARDYITRYLELEEIIGIATDFKNPLEGMQPVNNFSDAEVAAIKLRETWKLGNDPIFNAIELLEDNNIKVIELDAGDAFDGMQTFVKGNNIPVIAININKVKKDDRKRFTVMHELGHLLLPIKHLSENEKEKLCHQFAAAVLFPAISLRNELGLTRHRLYVQELGSLKKQYGISIQAIVMRAKDLEIISENYCRQFFFFIKQMGWKVDEPIEYTGIEKSNRFDQLLFRALAEDLISMSKAAALKNMKLADFRSQNLLVG